MLLGSAGFVSLVLPAACVAPTGDDTASVAADPPLAWDYAGDAAADPVPAADLTARIQEAIDGARNFDAAPLVAGFYTAMGGVDAVCPTYYNLGEYHYWYDDCVSSTGTRYNGYTFTSELAALDNPDYTHEGLSLWGSSTMTLPTGEEFHLGGRVEDSTSEGQEQKVWISRVTGTFTWDGPEADGTWLGSGYDLDVELVANRLEDGSEARTMLLDGGIDGFAAPLPTVRYETLHLTDSGVNQYPDCSLEPFGAIAVRDDAGQWYEVSFDGPEIPEGVPTDAQCDGCGHATWQGVAVYDVCIDFGALMDWGAEGPW